MTRIVDGVPGVGELSAESPRSASARLDAGDVPRLREVALAAVATSALDGAGTRPQEEALLDGVLGRVIGKGASLHAVLEACLRSSAPEDDALIQLGHHLGLSAVEILTVALAASAEDDLLTGRILAHVQAPVGGSRPTFGLLSRAFSTTLGSGFAVVPTLLNGAARLLRRVQSAGSIFLGDYSAVAAGDYASGTNHSLPTAVGARLRGGLGAADFVKTLSAQRLSRRGLHGLRRSIVTLARAEGLKAHAYSVETRFQP